MTDLESHLFDLGDLVVIPTGAVGIVIGLWLSSDCWRYQLKPANYHSDGVLRAWWKEDVLRSPTEVGIDG